MVCAWYEIDLHSKFSIRHAVCAIRNRFAFKILHPLWCVRDTKSICIQNSPSAMLSARYEIDLPSKSYIRYGVCVIRNRFAFKILHPPCCLRDTKSICLQNPTSAMVCALYEIDLNSKFSIRHGVCVIRNRFAFKILHPLWCLRDTKSICLQNPSSAMVCAWYEIDSPSLLYMRMGLPYYGMCSSL